MYVYIYIYVCVYIYIYIQYFAVEAAMGVKVYISLERGVGVYLSMGVYLYPCKSPRAVIMIMIITCECQKYALA